MYRVLPIFLIFVKSLGAKPRVRLLNRELTTVVAFGKYEEVINLSGDRRYYLEFDEEGIHHFPEGYILIFTSPKWRDEVIRKIKGVVEADRVHLVRSRNLTRFLSSDTELGSAVGEIAVFVHEQKGGDNHFKNLVRLIGSLIEHNRLMGVITTWDLTSPLKRETTVQKGQKTTFRFVYGLWIKSRNPTLIGDGQESSVVPAVTLRGEGGALRFVDAFSFLLALFHQQLFSPVFLTATPVRRVGLMGVLDTPEVLLKIVDLLRGESIKNTLDLRVYIRKIYNSLKEAIRSGEWESLDSLLDLFLTLASISLKMEWRSILSGVKLSPTGRGEVDRNIEILIEHSYITNVVRNIAVPRAEGYRTLAIPALVKIHTKPPSRMILAMYFESGSRIIPAVGVFQLFKKEVRRKGGRLIERLVAPQKAEDLLFMSSKLQGLSDTANWFLKAIENIPVKAETLKEYLEDETVKSLLLREDASVHFLLVV